MVASYVDLVRDIFLVVFIIDSTGYLIQLRNAHLIFKKNEAALELVIQQSIQLAMLLLSMTRYPVATGMQGIFGKDFSTIDS